MTQTSAPVKLLLNRDGTYLTVSIPTESLNKIQVKDLTEKFIRVFSIMKTWDKEEEYLKHLPDRFPRT